MERFNVWLDSELQCVINFIADKNKCDKSKAVRIILCDYFLKSKFVNHSYFKDIKQDIAFLKYELARKTRKKQTEQNCIASNLKNKILMQIIKGNTAARIFKILQINLEDCLQLMSAEEQNFFNSFSIDNIQNMIDWYRHERKVLGNRDAAQVPFDSLNRPYLKVQEK